MHMIQKSVIDELTGLYNRRYLGGWINTELARCKRYSLPLSIALIDLDDFKQINDLKGHLTGDNVLIQFSQFLQDELRAADMIVRYGGDEFIIIFPNTKKEQSYAVMKRILDKVKRKTFGGYSLSASCGISSFPEDGSEWKSLFQIADRRMYQVKRVNKGGIGIKEISGEELQIPTIRIVGRKRELSLCSEYTKREENNLIIISGEAGVGKTRLVNEVIPLIPDRILFTGSSYPAMSQSPYYAARHVLQSLVSKYEETVREIFVEHLNLPQKRVISNFLPNLTQGFSKITGDRLMLFDTITKFIDKLSKKVPLAILFDDLHWASDSTLDLLHFLLKSRKAAYPIFGTYRSEKIKGTPLSEKIALIGREGLYREISLETLDENSTEEMIGTILNNRVFPSLVKFIYKESGGNPFFIEEILKEMKESGALYKTEDGYELDKGVSFHIPKTIEDTVTHKLSLVDEKLLEVTNIAVLIGGDFDFSLLHSIIELNEGELYDQLDQLKEFQFLHEKEGNIYSFKEDVIRQVIADKIPTDTRRKLHEKIAETIEKTLSDSPEKFEQLAYHYYNSGNKKKSVEYAERAGDHAKSIYAHNEAIRLYNWALEGEMGADRRGRIYKKIGEELSIKGEYANSIENFNQALNNIEDKREKAGIYKELGHTYVDLGNYTMALFNLREARKNYSSRQDKYSCDPYMAWVYMEMGKEKSAVRSAERATVRIDKERFPKEYAQALNTMATINRRRGKNNKALKLYDEARKITEDIGYKKGVGALYTNMANVYLHMNDLNNAKGYSEKAMEIYGDTGFKEGEIVTLFNLGNLEMRRNELNKAENYLRKALEMEEWVGGIKSKVLLLNSLGYISLIKGTQKDALNLYKLAEEEAKKTESPEELVRIYANMVTVYTEYLRNIEKAEQYLKKGEKLLSKIDSGITLARFHTAKAKYYLEIGEIEDGINILKDLLLPLAKKVDEMPLLISIYLLWAQFYSKKEWGKWGVRYIEMAMEYAKKSEDIYNVAEVHRGAGKFYVYSGNPKEAKKHFNKALSIFKDIKFSWYIQDIQRELKKIQKIS